VLSKILLQDAPRLKDLVPDIPERLDRLVAAMLAKDASARPRDAGVVAQLLAGMDAAEISTRAPATARPPSLTATEQRLI
jgi:acyl carrier protein phosphodiesterase